MRIKADLIHSPEQLRPEWCQVEKVVELDGLDFDAFLIAPQEEHLFLEENAELMHQWNDVNHCLLVLAKGRADGVLIDSEGGPCARYAAYLPQARALVNAGLERAVDFIVRQGTENTASWSWCVCYEELNEKLGVAICKGNGLDAMLKEMLERRPEVVDVSMSSDAIEASFRPEFCARLHNSTPEEKPDIRLRDILPLLTGGGLTFLTHEEADTSVLAENLRELTTTGREDHAALLNAKVSEISPSPEGAEVVLTDVDPEELARFNLAYEDHQAAEQAMGPTM